MRKTVGLVPPPGSKSYTMMTEDEIARAMARLDGLQGRGINYDLGAMQRVLEKRAHPERACKAVIVAGTNGKGSTSAMLHAMLQRLGFRVGLYTSPHLFEVTERMRMESPIAREELAEWVLSYDAHGLLDGLTYYEALTAIAFDWFRDMEAEWVILEVGVGGRLDAVNLAPAAGSVITTVALDHRELLGDTIEAIAREKAGVIKEYRPVVTGALPAEAAGVVDTVVSERNAMLYTQGGAWQVEPTAEGFTFEGLSCLSIPRLGLAGDYQWQNAGCALAALERIVGVDLTTCADSVREALAGVSWPGRFQELSAAPLIVVDGAHNPAGARVLASAFRRRYGDRALKIAFASLAGKEHNAMLAALAREGVSFVLTDIPGEPRALPARELAKTPSLTGLPTTIETPRELIERLQGAQPDEAWLVTGSIAFAGWFLRNFKAPRS